MKKILCLLLILVFIFSLAALSACKKPVENPPVDLDEQEKENTTLQKPEGKTPDQLSAKESLYVAAGELERSGGFTAKAVGSTTSLMGISQSISAERTVVGKNVFKQSTSFSTFVKSGEQLYVFGENYLVRKAKNVSGIDKVTWENTATKYSTEAWNQLIGYRPNGLTGYILNDNTILDAFLVSAENGLYTFRYVLDTQKAPHYLLYEMRHNANSDRFPYFTKAEIVVTMDENFIVKTLSTDCEYRASSGGLSDLPCTENLTETFNVGYTGELPQKEFFEQFFDANAQDQVEEKQETALDVLTSMLDEYLTKGKTLNAELTVSQNKTEYLSALVALNVDLNNLEALSLDAKIGDNLYLNYANNRVLVNFQAFKGSTTIDGVLQYISSLFTGPFGSTVDFEIDTDALLRQMTYEIKNDVARVSLPFNVANLHVEANLYGTVQEKGVYRFRNAVLGIGNLVVRLTPTESWEVPTYEGEYPEILSLTKLLNNGKIALQTQILDTAAKVMLDVATQQIFVNTDYFDCTLLNNTVYANVGDAKIKLDLNAADTILALVSDLTGSDLTLPLPQGDDTATQSIWDVINNLTATKQGENTVLTVNVGGFVADIVLVEQTDGWWVDSVRVNMGEQQLALTPTEQFEVVPIGDTAAYADVTQAAIDFIPKLALLKNAESYQVDFGTVWQFDGDSLCLYGDAVVEPYGESLALDLDFDVVRNFRQIVTGNATIVNDYLYLTVNDVKVAISVADLGTSAGSSDTGSNVDEVQNVLSNLPLEIADDELKSVVDKIISIVERVQQGLSAQDVISMLKNLSYGENDLTLGLDGQLLDLSDFDLVATVLNKGIALSFDELLLGEASVYAVASVVASDEQVVIDCPEEYAGNANELFASLNLELALESQVQLGSEVYDLSAWAIFGKNDNVQISALMSLDEVRVLDVTAYVCGNKLYLELDGVRVVTTLPTEGEGGEQGDTTAAADLLSTLRGKNEYLDKLLSYIEEIANKAQNGELSADKLLKNIVVDKESVSVVLDGTELCVQDVNLTISADGVALFADGFAYEDIYADVTASASIADKVVDEPDGDWYTYLSVKLDEHNTLFAQLDLLKGIVVFKLENDLPETSENGTTTAKAPLFVEYTTADNFVRLKKGDVKLCGDMQKISDFVAYIDGLVKDFVGQGKNDFEGDLNDGAESSLGKLSALAGVDIAKLLNGLSAELSVDKQNNSAILQISASELSATAFISNQNGTKIDSVDLSLGGLTFRVSSCAPFELPDFGDKAEYVDLNKVLNDYRSTIDALTNTHSWIFYFNGDSQIDVKDDQGNTTSYQIAAGSYAKLYFNASQPQDTMLRADIVLKQLKNGVWEDFLHVDAALVDGRIYVTCNETMKFTIPLEAIANGAEPVGELGQTIPQPRKLQNELADEGQRANKNLLSIIKSLGFDKDGALGIVLDGKSLSDKLLGDVTIFTSRTSNTLTLKQLSLTYDNVTLNLRGITVAASDKTQPAEGETVQHDYENYVAAKEILQYFVEHGDESAHVDFDSLQKLLQALKDAANKGNAQDNGK